MLIIIWALFHFKNSKYVRRNTTHIFYPVQINLWVQKKYIYEIKTGCMKKYFFIISGIFILQYSIAQQVTKQDYARAVSFLWQNLNNKKVFNVNIRPAWFADSSGFSYSTQTSNGIVFHKLDFKTMKTDNLFDQDRLAKLLSDSLQTSVNSNQLQLNSLRHIDNTRISFTMAGKNFILDLTNYSLTKDTSAPANEMESKSPDGKWIAYTENYNLYIRSAADGRVKQLSKDGKRFYEFATYYGWSDIIEGENGERPKRFSVNWSPDSKWIQTYICDFSKAKKMYLLDWSVDTLYRARLLSYYRASPGDTDMIYEIPVFYNIETGEEMIKNEYRSVQDHGPDFFWSKEPGIVYLDNRLRGYQQVDIERLDLNKQTRELLYQETSPTNIDGFSRWLIEEWGKLVILSERDGWRQIYLLDLKDKSLKPLTGGSYYINDLITDIKGKSIYFLASGKEEGRNPYYQYGYKIGIDGKGLILLTPENANHDLFVSPDGKFFVDNVSAPDRPTITVLRETKTGKVIIELSKAQVEDLLAMNYHYPETFTAIARDGVTTIYGAIWKPSNFDPAKKYPVIDQSYTGPHTNMFPRNFATSLTRSNQALAELGFIVITVDGMGTAGRSKAFHNVSYKNMGKNLLDHVLAIRQLGQKYSWIDTSRVGIFGHSAGGYDAGHALLEFPDFYKVGVASSADHDFRMEKDWWPEMYMGWPVDSSYHFVSNITMAGNLKGKLLITHGGIDENVNPSATFKLAEALVKANKEFDMLIFPSQRHGYVGNVNEYFTKKRWNYFVEHLLSVKPIWDFELK